MSNIEFEYQIERATRALSGVLEFEGNARISTQPLTYGRKEVVGQIGAARVAFIVGVNNDKMAIVTSVRLFSDTHRYGDVAVAFTNWSPEIDAGVLLARAFIHDVKNSPVEFTCFHQTIEALNDTIAPHSFTISRSRMPEHQPRLHKFFGEPTHTSHIGRELSTKFTYYHPLGGPKDRRLDIYEEVSPSGRQVVCQLISRGAWWHGRYARVVRNDAELNDLAEIIRKAAENSPFQDEHIRVLVRKMDYRELPPSALETFGRLQGQQFKVWCGLSGSQTKDVRQQLRRKAAPDADHLCIRRGLPLPVSIRREFDLVFQANGLPRPKVYIHDSREIAIQVARGNELGGAHFAAWWDQRRSTSASNEIHQSLGRLTVLLSEPPGTLREFSKRVRQLLLPPSGFTYSDLGPDHPEVNKIADRLSRRGVNGLEARAYQPLGWEEALFNIVAGVQTRWVKLTRGEISIKHHPALIRNGRVQVKGSLTISKGSSVLLNLPSPSAPGDSDKVGTALELESTKTPIKILGALSIARSAKPVLAGLRLKLAADFVAPQRTSPVAELMHNGAKSNVQKTVLRSNGLKITIVSPSEDHAVIALTKTSRPGPRPRELGATLRWGLEKLFMGVLQLVHNDIRVEASGTGIQWAAVTSICQALGSYLEVEQRKALQKHHAENIAPTGPNFSLFSDDASGKIRISGFAWACSYERRNGVTTETRSFPHLLLDITEILVNPATVSRAYEKAIEMLTRKWLG